MDRRGERRILPALLAVGALAGIAVAGNEAYRQIVDTTIRNGSNDIGTLVYDAARQNPKAFNFTEGPDDTIKIIGSRSTPYAKGGESLAEVVVDIGRTPEGNVDRDDTRSVSLTSSFFPPEGRSVISQVEIDSGEDPNAAVGIKSEDAPVISTEHTGISASQGNVFPETIPTELGSAINITKFANRVAGNIVDDLRNPTG